ncbi:hypothetical protein [Pantoea agglomerans]|uniref:hypothetical protein n=1 Tax=Enterobacter agglomerans TaxID=549 RepID=UPI001FD231B3|nr:hypothetical protein [Pantoea agglomerans]
MRLMTGRKVAEINVREDDRVLKKSALHLLHYLLVFISSLILITCAGYYLFFCDWNVTMMGKIINGFVITISVTASFSFYLAAEKIREIY